MKPLTPIKDKILVRILPQDGQKSSGGIFIPDNTYKKHRVGEVLKKGKDANPDIKIGDKVLIPHGIGEPYEEDKLFIRGGENSHDIVMVLE